MAIQDPSVTSKRQRSKEYKSRPFFRLLFNRKEPGEGSGAASTYHRKTYFQIFWPSSFLYQKTRGSGATLNECNFLQKLHSLHSKEKNSEDIKTERPSSFLCQTAEARGLHSLSALFSAKSAHQSEEESKKTISRFHFKKNPYQVYNNSALEAQSWNTRGLIDGEPYGPP